MKQKSAINLSKAHKLLLVIYEMSRKEKRSLRYEDIVVAAFKKNPEDFHLRGYDEYPDSGDLVHKPLYDFRKKGLLEANNKVFSLTDMGFSFAERLVEALKGKEVVPSDRLSRFAEKEISRIESTEGFKFFLEEDFPKLTDTDFYMYMGTTPRTPRNDFIGRMESVNNAVKELENKENLTPVWKKVLEYHGFITNKFKDIIKHFNPNKNA